MKFTTGALSFPSKPGNHQHWTGISGCAQAICVAELAQKESNLIVCITANAADYHRITREAKYFIGENTPIFTFPDWETLAYDRFSPHEDIVSERIRTLAALPSATRGLMVVPAHTVMQRVLPYTALQARTFAMTIGQRLENSTFSARLLASGYQASNTVYNPGEFVIRGAVIDIFPMGASLPYRIERFDDDIETIRTFDPESQRTIAKVDHITLLPGRECPLDDRSIAWFRDQFEDLFPVNPTLCPLYQDIKQGIPSAGMEYYLPLFYESTSTLFDYLPVNSLLITMPGLNQVMDNNWQDWHQRYEDRRHDKYHPILPPHHLIIPVDEVHHAFNSMRRITLHQDTEMNTAATSHSDFKVIPPLSIESRKEDPIAKLRSFIAKQYDAGKPVFIAAESTGRREGLQELLSKHDIQTQSIEHVNQLSNQQGVFLGVAPLDAGVEARHIVIIAESQLFGERVMQRRRRTTRDDAGELAIRSLLELEVGDPVVHVEHGIGRYLGLQTIEVDNQQQEFLALEYADEAKLYVPVADLHQIARYTAVDPALVPLHKLGSDQWSKAKQKASEKINDVAAELLSIYARRAAQRGVAFEIAESDYDRFCQQFPFEETPDQAAAIDAVLTDLERERPMDRLICGDVGFGKTEVALRAAFIAVNNNKQVAVLVPTTLLAQQHFQSFRDRFASWPIKVELLSRFRTTKQVNTTLEALRAGAVDIVIGTHKLLQEDVEFKNLGLIIVDEEHRFGVKHKEQLKNLRANVDFLTLTATPIPRTLNMAFSGIRDLSIIATPPAKRLSIKTFVRQNDDALIKEAILRELLRGGQVYYLHNEVKTIEQTATHISKLVPEARVIVAHGQMPERALENVMSDFYHKKFNVLVCSTIIETGIDIPSANTIIIDRADKFGLAQLHQLRGRVGRSHHQAYAYLMVPSLKAITSDAQKRLEVIAETDHLGAGFTLASHDLEIRGAGELLGSEQSGHINAVGYTLYMDMLNRAVKAIQSGKNPSLEQPLELNTLVNLRVPALIPDDYLPDVHNRLVMYKRISSAADRPALDEIKVEMIDRFGLLPDPLKRLFRQTQLKLDARAMGIKKIEANAQSVHLEMDEKTSIQPLKLVKLVQTRPNEYKLEGAKGLKYIHNKSNFEERFEAVEKLVEHLR